MLRCIHQDEYYTTKARSLPTLRYDVNTSYEYIRGGARSQCHTLARRSSRIRAGKGRVYYFITRTNSYQVPNQVPGTRVYQRYQVAGVAVPGIIADMHMYHVQYGERTTTTEASRRQSLRHSNHTDTNLNSSNHHTARHLLAAVAFKIVRCPPSLPLVL